MYWIGIEYFIEGSLKIARQSNRGIEEINYVIFHIHINVGYIGIGKAENIQ
jgi:hypothetical protein